MQIMSMQHSLDACVYLMRFNYFFIASSLKSGATHLLEIVSQSISSKFTVKSQN